MWEGCLGCSFISTGKRVRQCSRLKDIELRWRAELMCPEMTRVKVCEECELHLLEFPIFHHYPGWEGCKTSNGEFFTQSKWLLMGRPGTDKEGESFHRLLPHSHSQLPPSSRTFPPSVILTPHHILSKHFSLSLYKSLHPLPRRSPISSRIRANLGKMGEY